MKNQIDKEILCKNDQSPLNQINLRILDELQEENTYLKRVLKVKEKKIEELKDKILSLLKENETIKDDNEKKKRDLECLELEYFESKNIKKMEIKQNKTYFNEKNNDCSKKISNQIVLNHEEIAKNYENKASNTLFLDNLKVNIYWDKIENTFLGKIDNIFDLKIEFQKEKSILLQNFQVLLTKIGKSIT